MHGRPLSRDAEVRAWARGRCFDRKSELLRAQRGAKVRPGELAAALPWPIDVLVESVTVLLAAVLALLLALLRLLVVWFRLVLPEMLP